MKTPSLIRYDKFPLQIIVSNSNIAQRVPHLELALNEVALHEDDALHLLKDNPDYSAITHPPVSHRGTTIRIIRISPTRIEADFEQTYNPQTDIYEASIPLWTLYRAYC